MSKIIIETPSGFKDVSGFTGYAVDRCGTILTFHFRKGKSEWVALKPIVNFYGYHVVNLFQEGGSKTRQVHRLVLEAFQGPCPAGMEACHNNGFRTDNRLENLRWDTRANNHADMHDHGTAQVGSNHPNAKLTEDIIRLIKSARSDGATIASLALEHKVNKATIADIVKGRGWTHVK